MRRSLLALCTALTLVLTPTVVAADGEDAATATAAPETLAPAAPEQVTPDQLSPDQQPSPDQPPSPDAGPVLDDGAPVLEIDQRHGVLTQGDDLIGTPQPVVESGITSLPAPQPGAEVYPRPADGVYQVTGGGFGHGIGMSQYGAHGAGLAGLTHQQILAFYYPGTNLETRSTGTIRIGITIDNDGVTRVAHRPGLVVSSAPGGTTYQLPSGFSQWRVRATSASAAGCTLEGLDSGGTWRAAWPSGMSQSCPVSFSSPTEGSVDLYLPGGSVRAYRGTLTATFRGTTSLITVNHLPMQHYLRSVTMAEMPVSFHAEALKAQAVAARSYALRGAGGTAHYDTCDTTACQAYRGMGARNADGTLTWYEHANSTAAVNATQGQVLTYNFGGGAPQLATTMYSSSTGGHTTVGGAGHGYLVAQDDPYDAVVNNPRSSWTAQLPVRNLEQRYNIHRVERVQILRRDGHGEWGGRVLDARVEGFTAAGHYTWAYASGGGLQMSNPWPANANGLSSHYFTLEPTASGTVERISGEDRYDTAAEASRAWGRNVSVVYVVSGRDYPDALTAAARAGVYDAPVLLTRPDGLPGPTLSALQRLNPARVVVVGGPGAVATEVADQLRDLTRNRDLTRVGGTNRYATAAAMAAYYPAGRARVYLASGEDYPDALAGAALAGHEHMPLLLTRQDRLDQATVDQLRRLDAQEIVVLGGSGAVSDAVAQQAASHSTSGTYRRLAGDDRYATMARIAAQFPAGRTPAYVASAQDFPDALVGAAVAGGLHGVAMVLTANDRVRGATAAALTRQNPQSIYVLGGSTVVTDATLELLSEYLR
ncbi:cell wall-binding repeat-containing protein [Ornithinimicrobium sufpigmenti]|uniref:cell wall-binding repeat-containing protein n=1 Tax=Ornithinimicrobium sufpigmenti TaxID=2508882 RepID=UPI001035F561|nr:MULTISPECIES: cell wall-binding repeat-containing protein [unclassified Ornithinimicrobium]